MKNKSLALVITLMFAVALGAGVVAGKLSNRLPEKEPVPERGTLSDALKLSPEQRGRMEAIWEGVRDQSRACIAEAQAAQNDEDKAIQAFLTEEQKAKFKQLRETTFAKIAGIEQRRKAAFSQAVKETNGILDESQRKTYARIIRDRVGDLSGGTWEQP